MQGNHTATLTPGDTGVFKSCGKSVYHLGQRNGFAGRRAVYLDIPHILHSAAFFGWCPGENRDQVDTFPVCSHRCSGKIGLDGTRHHGTVDSQVSGTVFGNARLHNFNRGSPFRPQRFDFRVRCDRSHYLVCQNAQNISIRAADSKLNLAAITRADVEPPCGDGSIRQHLFKIILDPVQNLFDHGIILHPDKHTAIVRTNIYGYIIGKHKPGVGRTYSRGNIRDTVNAPQIFFYACYPFFGFANVDALAELALNKKLGTCGWCKKYVIHIPETVN